MTVIYVWTDARVEKLIDWPWVFDLAGRSLPVSRDRFVFVFLAASRPRNNSKSVSGKDLLRQL